MSTITLEPRTLGRTQGARPASEAIAFVRDGSATATVAVVEREFEESRREAAAESVRVMASVIAVTAVVFALPLLVLLPFFAMALFLGLVGLPFGGML
jgi:hypothetical protein